MTAVERQIRCQECNRRLADYESDIREGLVRLTIKCPKCEESNRVTLGPHT